MEALLTVGALARLTGATRQTIRWYEQIGLLPAPNRSADNYRLYGDDHLARLRFIRRCRDLGFSLEVVRNLADLAAKDGEDCADVATIANVRLIELDNRIATLMALRQDLAAVINDCAGGRVSCCRILSSFSPQQ
ncbi:helix-turn-helix domain-containing protein [Acidiphilium sp. PA]|uniref:MerR family transcriptional regulator n=1 Tax=Acidiphilium sp. PA TaxID=2871705 RepID=UPI002243FE6E|nr:helix-turn-helix domain-containing protein [Acidiphilium sp. PA]MCW8308027.1 helix-turn-helix domain-containing protein [Acidiphilium sp. PA]